MARPTSDCSLLIKIDVSGIQKESEFTKQLESKEDAQKIEALKKIIGLTQNGENLSKLLMPVIKYTLHSPNHTVKKLLLLYLEIVEKKDQSGHLLHEMILVCNHLKNNLNHPNEYIRGCTLRFLCKIKEGEILESLIPSITANLTHRHSYVRKNAILTVLTIYKHLPDLIPDALELMEKLISDEQNPAAKKNAFLMLFQCDQTRAVKYLQGMMENIATAGDSLQLTILELIRKVCRTNPQSKANYLRAIHTLVTIPSHAVSFEAANTLVALSSAPIAIRSAITAYCSLLASESDNNIKLVILGRLANLKKKNQQILSEMLMDILRTLSSPNLDIRKKTLVIAMDLVSPRNVEQVIGLLKKELQKTESPQQESNPEEYRKLLVDTMHKCAARYPEVVSSVVHLLMNYLSDATEGWSSAMDVIHFVREVVEEYEQLQEGILNKLMSSFEEIRAPQVYRVALWILGEYCVEPELLERALLTIRTAVGTIPFPLEELTAAAAAAEGKVEDKKEKKEEGKKPNVLADGSYVSQSYQDTKKESSDGKIEGKATGQTLRQMLLGGEWFLASQLVASVTKLNFRYTLQNGYGSPLVNEERGKALLLIVSLLRLGTCGVSSVKVLTHDADQRLRLCMRYLLDASPSVKDVDSPPEKKSDEKGDTIEDYFLDKNRQVFSGMLVHNRREAALLEKAEARPSVEPVKQVDDLITIRQLRGKHFESDDSLEDDEADLTKALGSNVGLGEPLAKLQRIYQLTGYGDPVYAEAKLNVMQFDIILDILVMNTTEKILQNLTVELCTSGDLKVVERPQTVTMKPKGVVHVRGNIKVTSTDAGIIFGNIVYDSANGTEKTVVVLNNIHMDIMDYISPAFCTDLRFRHMWAEFEWENKVAVHTDIQDLNEYLNHLVKITNMHVMTSKSTMEGDSVFLAANLYARSMFGEDAVLNLSIERTQPPKKEGSGDAPYKVIGFIRIRSKTQGIALSLGDKITSSQKVR